MKRDDEVSWGRLGRIEKLFLVLMAIWALLFFTGMAQKYQTPAALAAILMGVRRASSRSAAWRCAT